MNSGLGQRACIECIREASNKNEHIESCPHWEKWLTNVQRPHDFSGGAGKEFNIWQCAKCGIEVNIFSPGYSHDKLLNCPNFEMIRPKEKE